MADDILFFGCWGHPGHYLWAPGGRRAERAAMPAQLQPSKLDSPFAPKDPHQIVGRACLHHVAGWTVVAWWDRSGDRRRNSNSALLMRGTHPLHAVLLAAGEHFPELLPRFATLELVPT